MTSSATPTSSSSTFDRLAAQGYVVLRQFLAPAECAELRAMYARLPPSVDGIGLNVRYLTLPPSIVRRVHAVLRELGAAGANVDTDARSNPFLSAEATVYGTKQARQDNKFPWHVDHGSYYFLQSHADYLNFYIPFLKEDPARSGLGVIPADALAAADPAFARRFPGGATTFYKCPDGPAPYYCRFDCEDLAHPVHCDLDAVARFPSLRAGDLLLLRMTTIHCTQDNETARIAFTAKAVGTRYIEEVAWGSLSNVVERFGFYPGRFLYLLNMVGASPVKVSQLHAELVIIALTAFLCRPVPKLLRPPTAVVLRYTIMPAIALLLATKMLIEWPTVWILRGIRDQLRRGHGMPFTALVPFTMMVSLHFVVVAAAVVPYYAAIYFAAFHAAPLAVAMVR